MSDKRRRTYGSKGKVEFETNGYFSTYKIGSTQTNLAYSSDALTWSDYAPIYVSSSKYIPEVMCIVHENDYDALIYVLRNQSSDSSYTFIAYHVPLNSDMVSFIKDNGSGDSYDDVHHKSYSLGIRTTLGYTEVYPDDSGVISWNSSSAYGIEYDDEGNYLLALGLVNDKIILVQYNASTNSHDSSVRSICSSDYMDDAETYNIGNFYAVPYIDQSGSFKCLTLASGYYTPYGSYATGQYTKIMNPSGADTLLINTLRGGGISNTYGWYLLKSEYGIYSASLHNNSGNSSYKYLNIYEFDGSSLSTSVAYTTGASTKSYYGFFIKSGVDRITAENNSNSSTTGYVSNVIGSGDLSFSSVTFSKYSGRYLDSKLGDDLYMNTYYEVAYIPSTNTIKTVTPPGRYSMGSRSYPTRVIL